MDVLKQADFRLPGITREEIRNAIGCTMYRLDRAVRAANSGDWFSSACVAEGVRRVAEVHGGYQVDIEDLLL